MFVPSTRVGGIVGAAVTAPRGLSGPVGVGSSTDPARAGAVEDSVELSPEALANDAAAPADDDVDESRAAVESSESNENEDAAELSEEERAEVEQLEARDAEVRRHEMAHAAAGGQYAGSPNYDFETGPDGRRYAVGGHVNIDVGEVPGDPAKTIEKMRVVRAAAMAPAEPSGQDRRVAAEAAKKEAAAHAELAEQKRLEAEQRAQSVGPAAEGDGDASATESATVASAAEAPMPRAEGSSRVSARALLAALRMQSGYAEPRGEGSAFEQVA